MSKEDIFDVIVRHAREVIPNLRAHSFKHTDSLRALGANSVDRADIIMLTLESLSVNVPLAAMAGAEDIGELAGIIQQKR
jgi:polyketide biosynthesis acyl carrier protein